VIGTTKRQGNLFFAAFGQQASRIKDDLLDEIDRLLDDDVLVSRVDRALATHSRYAATRGRTGIAPDRLLRLCVLKQLKGWSFRELEREVRDSLVYRRFTRFDADAIPDFSSLSRNFGRLGDAHVRRLHEDVVERARAEKVARGRRMRTDTTVVETNIHHPTDSTLLADGIRVLTRSLRKIADQCVRGAVHAPDSRRSVTYRLLEIHRAARLLTEPNRRRMQKSYRQLLKVAARVRAGVRSVGRRMARGQLPVVGSVTIAAIELCKLGHFDPLLARVMTQTEARVFGGNRHAEGKIVSLFEPHTEIIRKGKAHKPTEFGRLVRIDEIENGIVSGYEVLRGNPSDKGQLLPAVRQHSWTFGRAPRVVTADRGYFTVDNETKATDEGVSLVAVPGTGKLSPSRARSQKRRAFRRALRWRAGIESRIATLKHRFGMARASFKGERGFLRYVGWSIVCQNLVALVRVRVNRRLAEAA
jgi:IS5 family transposase